MRRGHEMEARCPFHNDKTPSFKVNDAKGFFHCFGCGAHGDVFEWLERQRGMPMREALAFLGAEVGEMEPPAAPEAVPEWVPAIQPPEDAERPDLSGFDTIYTYSGADGSPLFYVRRKNASGTRRKTFVPLTYGALNGKSGWFARHPAAPRPLYGLDRLAGRPEGRVVVCEGEKAADAAQIALGDCACVSWPVGTANVAHSDWTVLHAREVYIWPDNDAPGAKAAAEIVSLLPQAKILRVADLPARSDAADMVPDEIAGWLDERIKELTRKAKANGHAPHNSTHNSGQETGRLDGHPHPLAAAPPLHDPRLPVIRVLLGLRHIAVDQGLDAMRVAAVPFYQRDRQLVRAALSKAKTAGGAIIEVPSLIPITPPILARALGQSAEWERVNKDGDRIRIDPPKEVVEQAAALSGHWPFPPVSGVIGTPTMRPDGSLLLEPGYDEATGLVLVSPPALPEIKDHPSRSDAGAALDHIRSLLTEFPFSGEASSAAAVSMILTPVLRGALGAAVPMHVVAAPQAGTGKSYLQDVASALATGERCAVITVSPDPNETEKRLIGAALAGFPIIALDNCNGTLSGDFLAQVTERPLLQLRPLGSSGVVRIANIFTVFANGNNIAVAADLVRRTILCTLDANMEAPESREFSRDPVAEILRNRGSYLKDCLTIARAYHCAGYPDRLPRTPSFERWSDLVRSALVWLGMDDPGGNSETVKADDPTRSARVAIFAGWLNAMGEGSMFTSGQVITEAELFDGATGYRYPDFRAALLEVAKAKSADRIDAQRFGWWLHKAAKIVVGQHKLVVDRTNESRQRWGIVKV